MDVAGDSAYGNKGDASRRRWESPLDGRVVIAQPREPAHRDAHVGARDPRGRDYDEYLALLAERNRALGRAGRARAPKPEDDALRDREKAFSAYVNGANTRGARRTNAAAVPAGAAGGVRPRASSPVTVPNHSPTDAPRDMSAGAPAVGSGASRTPPKRKGWVKASIEIRTKSGESVRIHAPRGLRAPSPEGLLGSRSVSMPSLVAAGVSEAGEVGSVRERHGSGAAASERASPAASPPPKDTIDDGLQPWNGSEQSLRTFLDEDGASSMAPRTGTARNGRRSSAALRGVLGGADGVGHRSSSMPALNAIPAHPPSPDESEGDDEQDTRRAPQPAHTPSPAELRPPSRVRSNSLRTVFDASGDSQDSVADRVPSRSRARSGSLRSLLDDTSLTATKRVLSEPHVRAPVGADAAAASTERAERTHAAPSKISGLSLATGGELRVVDHQEIEDSWDSLSHFLRTQAGRLSLDKSLRGSSVPAARSEGHADVVAGARTHGVAVAKVDVRGSVARKAAAMPNTPVLPRGRVLELDILTTHGDESYVGLNGIEVFCEDGSLARVRRVSADPPDINVLPEYGRDPRVVGNLIDGVNRTCDDLHMWLAPFTPGGDHFVRVEFAEAASIAMVRIWNYNKSRIHAFRGAKDVEMRLDGALVFAGELSRAPGNIEDRDGLCDVILFTTDATVLDAVARNDAELRRQIDNEREAAAGVPAHERPRTATRRPDPTDAAQLDPEVPRPFTTAGPVHGRGADVQRVSTKREGVPDGCATTTGGADRSSGSLYGRSIVLTITGSWGGELVPHVIRPAGLRVCLDNASDVDPSGACEGDLRRLLDCPNDTTDESCMWRARVLRRGGRAVPYRIRIDLGEKRQIGGIRVWNYNASLESSYLGAKSASIAVDDAQLFGGAPVLLRKAPGHDLCDYAHDIMLCEMDPFGRAAATEGSSEKLVSLGSSDPAADVSALAARLLDYPECASARDYEVQGPPTGFTVQLRLQSTWGDPDYVGLNGIALYDGRGALLRPQHVSCIPESINELPGVRGDPRTPDKLIDGVNDTWDDRHMWLAPFVVGQTAFVYLFFEYPVTIAAMTIWNYAKTPSRGVKDFEVLVDDAVVFQGSLQTAPRPLAEEERPAAAVVRFGQSVVFARHRERRHSAPRAPALEDKAQNCQLGQDVQLIDNGRVVMPWAEPHLQMPRFSSGVRPQTTAQPAGAYRRASAGV